MTSALNKLYKNTDDDDDDDDDIEYDDDGHL